MPGRRTTLDGGAVLVALSMVLIGSTGTAQALGPDDIDPTEEGRLVGGHGHGGDQQRSTGHRPRHLAEGDCRGQQHRAADPETQDADDERVTTTITGMLGRKQKVPGFGHRVYRTEDPRATHLRQMSRDLGQQGGNSRWFEMSQRIEEVMRTETGINANVDFYSASTYHTLGIATDLFTPIFVVSRVSGWTAHALEQYANNRLIRPRAEYVGPEYPQSFVPLAERPPAFR